jgi:hypothetical protein
MSRPTGTATSLRHPNLLISTASSEGRELAGDDLEQLAQLVAARNEADRQIAALIGRPAAPGNIGEFVAARVFGIELKRLF